MGTAPRTFSERSWEESVSEALKDYEKNELAAKSIGITSGDNDSAANSSRLLEEPVEKRARCDEEIADNGNAENKSDNSVIYRIPDGHVKE